MSGGAAWQACAEQSQISDGLPRAHTKPMEIQAENLISRPLPRSADSAAQLGQPGATSIPPRPWLNRSPPFCLINKIKGCAGEGEELGRSLETGELRVCRRNVQPPESPPATGLPFPAGAGGRRGAPRGTASAGTGCGQHRQRSLPARERHSARKQKGLRYSTLYIWKCTLKMMYIKLLYGTWFCSSAREAIALPCPRCRRHVKSSLSWKLYLSVPC